MKKLLAAGALLLGSLTAHAQTDPPFEPSAYTQLVDSLLYNTAKFKIPNLILYDRVVPIAGLHTFKESTVSNASHFFQSYQELYGSAFTQFPFPFYPKDLRPSAESASPGASQLGGVLAVGMLDFRFSVLDTLAEEKGTIREVNGLYYDNVGSPYQEQSVVVISPLADTVAQQVQLTWPSTFRFRNTSRTPTYIHVEAAGGAYALTPTSSPTITFPSSGNQTIKFMAFYDDGSSSVSHAQVYVTPSLATRPSADYDQQAIYPNIISKVYKDYHSMTFAGEGNAMSYLFHPSSRADQKLRNVILVMDGFDPLDQRKIDKVFSDFAPLVPVLATPGRQRDLVVLNFPKTFRSVIYSDGRTGTQEMDGGADFIERNALVVVEMLNRLKPLMADPNQKVTIIGPSMGGLISRYALALMEKNFAATNDNYWKHNVDTWFSFDAPHQGANIPRGDQEFLGYFSTISEKAALNAGRLNSVAAQQMLVDHRKDRDGNRYHEPFMRNLNNNGLPGSFGYPTQVRRVSLANGSITGKLNALLGQPGQTCLQMDAARTQGNKRRQFFYRSTTPGTQIATNVYYAPGANATGTVFNAEARVIVALAKLIAKRRNIRVTSGPQGSYDLAPGSTFDSQFQIQKGTIESKPLPGIEYRFSNLRPDHSFIPTVSALAFQYRNMANYSSADVNLPNPYTDLSTRQLICADETPFDAYYAYPASNGPHVTLDNDAQLFVVRELWNISQPARFALDNVKLVCPNTTQKIRLSDCSQRTTGILYTWSVTGPATFRSNGGTSITTNFTDQDLNITGAGTVTVSVVANRYQAAASPSVSYSFEASNSGNPLAMSVPQACNNRTVTVTASGPTSGPYYWTTRTMPMSGVPGPVSNFTTQTPTLQVALRTERVEVTVTAPNPCGTNLPRASRLIAPQSCFDGESTMMASYAMSPVPADQSLTISTVDETNQADVAKASTLPDAENPHAYQAEFYNDRGKKLKTVSTKKGTLQIPTADLPSGLYHVIMRHGNQQEKRNIIIQH